MQQKLSQKEKETKEENLRLLAQCAQEECSDVSQTVSSRPTAESHAAAVSALGGYSSNSGIASSGEEAAKLQDDLHAEKCRE